jgi:hypothetical protein
VYYGALLYLGHLGGRLWPAVLAQAAAVLLAIALTLRAFGLFTWTRLTVVSLVLVAVTPVAFFTSFLMPDVFAAVAILAIANLLVLGNRMPGWMVATWVALLSAALLFHTSHLLIALVALVVAPACALLARARMPVKGIAGVAAAVAAAVAGEAAFNAGVARLAGSPPIRPPFVMARMIADGPGYRYAAASCPEARLAVCRFVPRLRTTDFEAFLWSTDSARGVFAVADGRTRRRLASEQYRFAWATLAFDPVGQSVASLRNTGEQLGRVGLTEFNYNAHTKGFFTERVPGPYLEELKTTRAWSGAMPTRAMSVVIGAATVASLLYLVGAALPWRGTLPRDEALLIFAAVVVGGLIVNAAVCGALAALADRYQARVVWLLPLVAMLLHLRIREGRAGRLAAGLAPGPGAEAVRPREAR